MLVSGWLLRGFFGSFPHPGTVLKGGLIKELLSLLLPVVVTVTVRGNDPKDLLHGNVEWA